MSQHPHPLPEKKELDFGREKIKYNLYHSLLAVVEKYSKVDRSDVLDLDKGVIVENHGTLDKSDGHTFGQTYQLSHYDHLYSDEEDDEHDVNIQIEPEPMPEPMQDVIPRKHPIENSAQKKELRLAQITNDERLLFLESSCQPSSFGTRCQKPICFKCASLLG